MITESPTQRVRNLRKVRVSGARPEACVCWLSRRSYAAHRRSVVPYRRIGVYFRHLRIFCTLLKWILAVKTSDLFRDEVFFVAFDFVAGVTKGGMGHWSAAILLKHSPASPALQHPGLFH